MKKKWQDVLREAVEAVAKEPPAHGRKSPQGICLPTFDERSGTVTKEAMDKFLDFAFADECEVRAFLRKFVYKK